MLVVAFLYDDNNIVSHPLVGSCDRSGSRFFNDFIIGVKSYMRVTNVTLDKRTWASPAFLEGGQDRARGRHLTAANTLSAFSRGGGAVCFWTDSTSGGGGGAVRFQPIQPVGGGGGAVRFRPIQPWLNRPKADAIQSRMVEARAVHHLLSSVSGYG